jgi:membrane associated rhomboid family serine protease
MRRPAGGINWSATIVLLALNIAAFVFQVTLMPRLIDSAYLALSLEGLLHGYIWQLLTFQFMHGSVMHLLLNCWALFIFGREVEFELGKPRFLTLYFVSGVIGGLFQMLVSHLWPNYFGGPVVGASAGVFGVVAAFAMLYPTRRLTMLLFYVIPVNMKAKSLLWFCLIVAALGIGFPNSIIQTILGGNVAHAAHLGGILTGLALVRRHPAI